MRITSVSPSSAHAMPLDLAAPVTARIRDPTGRPRFRAGRDDRFGRQDADYREGLVVGLDGRADGLWVTVKQPLPQVVSEKHDFRSVGPVLFGKEVPAEDRLNAEDPEKVGRDIGGRRAHRLRHS